MLLISEVEKAFGVRFNFREIVKMKNVGGPLRRHCQQDEAVAHVIHIH